MINDIFTKGYAKILKQEALNEAGKTGKLRGGNTGHYTPKSNSFIGKCASLTYLRMKGIVVEENNDGQDLMFAAGRFNENAWLDVIKEGWDGIIKCEEEIPTSWETKNGIAVTGRPDMVLCDKEGKPVVGIELKLCSSLWTCRDVLFENNPRVDHILQALHYSWQLGVPFELWYTNRVKFACSAAADWAGNLFPRKGQKNSEYLEYEYHKMLGTFTKGGNERKKTVTEEEYLANYLSDRTYRCDVKNILPFTYGYELDVFNDKVYYKVAKDDKAPWIETVLTLSGIKEYYEYISKMDEKNIVPPTPSYIKPSGEKLNYTAMQYCKLGELCCGKCAGTKLDSWVAKVSKKFTDKV